MHTPPDPEHLGGMEHLEHKESEETAPAPEQTEEQKQLTSDLHWLIHQGHVLNSPTASSRRPRNLRKTRALL